MRLLEKNWGACWGRWDRMGGSGLGWCIADWSRKRGMALTKFGSALDLTRTGGKIANLAGTGGAYVQLHTRQRLCSIRSWPTYHRLSHWIVALARQLSDLLDAACRTSSLVENLNGLLKQFLYNRRSFLSAQHLQNYPFHPLAQYAGLSVGKTPGYGALSVRPHSDADDWLTLLGYRSCLTRSTLHPVGLAGLPCPAAVLAPLLIQL